MDYIQTLLSSINNQKGLVAKHLNDEMMLRKEDLIKQNIYQIENHIGADGKFLNNTNSLFKGTYKQLTVDYAKAGIPTKPLLSKNLGDAYNFVWSGDFVNNFEMGVDGFDYKLFSTGTGSGSKKAFFDGYKNLYGIVKEERENLYNEVGYDIIIRMLNNIYKK